MSSVVSTKSDLKCITLFLLPAESSSPSIKTLPAATIVLSVRPMIKPVADAPPTLYAKYTVRPQNS